MKRSIRRNYLLSGGAVAVASLLLLVLIVTWPEALTTLDWIKFFTVVLVWLFSFFTFPFMQKIAGIRVFPEKMALPVLLGLIIIFFLIFASAQIIARGWILPLPVAAVLVIFGIGIANIIRHYLRNVPNKTGRQRPDS
jgi:hypothetical protein